ncbi:MAG: hypothetical protein WCO60_19530 [Verrucomicrobiota bacterium]
MKGRQMTARLIHTHPTLFSIKRVLFPSLAIVLAGCSTVSGPTPVGMTLQPGDPDAPSQVTPSEAISIAQAYTTHSWQPFARNILHGKDKRGVLVNTPDVGHQTPPERRGWWIPGERNSGMPYKWGGYDDSMSFDEGVAQGKAAGDVSSPAKRQADNAGVSEHAVGLDCSGFVSRCLKLPRAYDTTQLPAICRVLPSILDLRPGDILNIQRGHVILCAGWANAERSWIYYYETGGAPDYWKPGLKEAPLDALLALGYQPLRYKGMAYEPRPSGKEVLTRAARARAVAVPAPTVGEP